MQALHKVAVAVEEPWQGQDAKGGLAVHAVENPIIPRVRFEEAHPPPDHRIERALLRHIGPAAAQPAVPGSKECLRARGGPEIQDACIGVRCSEPWEWRCSSHVEVDAWELGELSFDLHMKKTAPHPQRCTLAAVAAVCIIAMSCQAQLQWRLIRGSTCAQLAGQDLVRRLEPVIIRGIAGPQRIRGHQHIRLHHPAP